MDSGDGVTHTVPIYEGYSLPHATLRQDFAGRNITNYFIQLLMERGFAFASSAEREIVRDIKEKFSFIAMDFDQELQKSFKTKSNEQIYELPDGQTIRLGSERFRASEILFRPNLVGQEFDGLHQTIFSSITRCDIDIRRELFDNIVLSGGSTMFHNLPERLQKELIRLTPSSIKIKLVAPAQRKFSVWLGGSILAGLSTFQHLWISKNDYDEYGSTIIHRRNFSS